MFNLLLRELRFRRNAIIGWGIGLCFLPIIYVGIYPEFADQMAGFEDLMDLAIYQAMGISMGGFEEYVASTVTNLVPVIVAIYAVINGTGTLAGEEDNGRLELIAALPIPRWQIVAVKAIALGIALFLILAIVAAGGALTMSAILDQVETTVSAWDLFLSILTAWPLVMAFGMISLFLGAFSASRRAAATIATAIVLISYIGSNLTGMITSLESIQGLFPFYYYDATASGLIDGQDPVNTAVLLAVSLFAFLLAIFFFQRRNLTVGAWPWQRGKLPADAKA